MSKPAYITMFFFITTFLLYWCWTKSNDSINNISQFQQKIIENKYLKKYYLLSESWNIHEKLQLNVQWGNDNSSFSLDIYSSSYKNIFSWIQNWLYSFQMTTEDKTFAETEIISWMIQVISKDKKYFVQPQNITFVWPKWKITNQIIEDKISEINNKRIKIDKEIPFTSTLKILISIQTILNQLRTKQLQVSLDGSGNIEITWSYSDIPVNVNLSYKDWFFYLSWNKQAQITKHSPSKFWLIFFWKNRNIQSDIKINKRRKDLTINFQWTIANNAIQMSTTENKLDIKWKYLIKSTWYSQVEMPNDYLNFTQTSLTKK